RSRACDKSAARAAHRTRSPLANRCRRILQARPLVPVPDPSGAVARLVLVAAIRRGLLRRRPWHLPVGIRQFITRRLRFPETRAAFTYRHRIAAHQPIYLCTAEHSAWNEFSGTMPFRR